MAEALGTAASVIAVIDLAGKAVTLTFKLKCLWDEVKDVPTSLLEKAEELQQLDEILRDEKNHAADNQLPTSAWNDAIMQKAMDRARSAMEDLQKTLDAYNDSIMHKRRYKRRLAAAKVVLQKESIVAMERKLDNALHLYRLAESRYIFRTCASINAQRLQRPLVEFDTVGTTSEKPTTSGNHMFESLRLAKSRLPKTYRPDISGIAKGTTLLGRLRFGLGYQTSHISIRTPNWFGNTVYSVMIQQSLAGWQLTLSSHMVVDEIPKDIIDMVENDDITSLQKYLHHAKLTPYVHERDGWNLLFYAAEFAAVEISQWLLSIGLYPGSFGEWSETPGGKTAVTYDTRTPLDRLLRSHGNPKQSERNVQILEAFMIYTPDIIEDDDDIWDLIMNNNTFQQYREIQRIMSPQFLVAPFPSRLWHCFRGLLEAHWTWIEVLCLLPEIRTLSTDSIASFWDMGNEKLALSHLVGLGVGWELLESNGALLQPSKEGNFCQALGNIARLNPEDLSHRSDTVAEDTPLAKMLGIILDEFGSHSPRIFDQVLQTAIRSWASSLFTNGVDLSRYGHKETIFNFDSREGRIPSWREGKVRRCSYFRVLGITYGALPEHWKVWWSVYDMEYAGDFWRMIEDPAPSIPGGWKDEFDSQEEERIGEPPWGEAPPWDDDERGDWIVWSEYRKIRPPF